MLEKKVYVYNKYEYYLEIILSISIVDMEV